MSCVATGRKPTTLRTSTQSCGCIATLIRCQGCWRRYTRASHTPHVAAAHVAATHVACLQVYEQEQALTNEDANKFEVAAAVSSIFEALLETLVQNYEQQQKDKNFNVNPPKIDFPKLPYQCRDVLLKQIMSVGQCVLERPSGSWAPQVQLHPCCNAHN